MVMDPEEKLLRAVVKIRQTEGGRPIRQEPLKCQACGTTVDVADPGNKVEFRDAQVNGKPFMVADAGCPKCGALVMGAHYVVN